MTFLKLMYITNRPDVAALADECGVDMIFIDLELMGKEVRQANMDSVISKHSPEDIKRVKSVLKNADILCRVNPIHEGSQKEIDLCIEYGADILMLPYFKTREEAEQFIGMVGGRVKTCLLVETAEAVECLDNVLKLPGIDMVHIGLNDLHLSYKKNFMFELLADGTVEKMAHKIKKAGIPFGFGGVARLGKGMLPAEYVIAEHYRLGSQMAILSRSFCNASTCNDISEVRDVFKNGLAEIYEYENSLFSKTEEFFEENKKQVDLNVNKIVEDICRLNKK
ncbi:MAG: aldolase [Clostridia bacterium]|nr:aldolase [Clostridia bacterium]